MERQLYKHGGVKRTEIGSRERRTIGRQRKERTKPVKKDGEDIKSGVRKS